MPIGSSLQKAALIGTALICFATANDAGIVWPQAGDAVGYCRLGDAFTARKQFGEAIESYTKAIELDRRFAGAYINRGAANKLSGNPSQAMADFNHAIEIDPRIPLTQFAVLLLFRPATMAMKQSRSG